MNNLIKRIKQVAFGMTNFRNWRIRVLLYAGRPDWSKLATVTPRPRSNPKSPKPPNLGRYGHLKTEPTCSGIPPPVELRR